ncbi:sialate O-acetylesterase [Flavimarina sp. Hel_I_48]|uniref:sialate O-acetylesterase n=1 Tax=Flavimarina sp. Hel_I_48 TaxID=1392488 RepID=UPI0004DFC212|nr:sialate O-acetylesterase [Flavimarina sp. Hel_I_48]
MKKINLLLFIALQCVFSVSSAQIKLPKLVSDGMVLQRDTPVNLWGWSKPQEVISIVFAEKNYTTRADSEGNWKLKLDATPAGGPYTIALSASNTITLNDVVFGDVWLCSGQSNMELPMSRVSPLYEDEIASANNAEIRYFEVPKTYDFKEEKQDITFGKWEKVTPETIENFSAVAYFFAKNLNAELQVPIGLINSSLGGSPAEAWISEEGLKKFPEYYTEAERFKDNDLIDSIEQSDQTRRDTWYKTLNDTDQGIINNWKSADFDFSGWKIMNIPGYWAATEIGDKNGSVWFKKQVEIPKKWLNRPIKLLMGRIVDADSIFVNDTFIGNTTYQYPPRRYEIPAGILRDGKNTITVRVLNESGKGGFVEEKPYKLVMDEQEIDLRGKWHYKLGSEMPFLQGQTFIRWKPEGLYNAMIAPFTSMNLKGVIWYQGESNADTPAEYQELFTTLIEDWRSKWNAPEFPFLFVQLANFMATKEEPGDSNWARLRDAQRRTLAVPHTGMAVTIDIGEGNDIHPLNKKDVGDRLAQAAKHVAHGKNVVAGSPLYDSMEIEGDTIIIRFKNTGSGLMAKNGKPGYFAIAGEDQKFIWADAVIKDDKILVSSPAIKNPVAVRYGWADNPEGANIYNKEGFPASPFRTDNW